MSEKVELERIDELELYELQFVVHDDSNDNEEYLFVSKDDAIKYTVYHMLNFSSTEMRSDEQLASEITQKMAEKTEYYFTNFEDDVSWKLSRVYAVKCVK